MSSKVLDNTDAADAICSDANEEALVGLISKEGRDTGAVVGLKLRQGSDMSRSPMLVNSGMRRDVADPVGRQRPGPLHVVFLITLLTLTTTSLFTLFDSITVFEVAHRIHALAGAVKLNPKLLQFERSLNGKREQLRASDFTHPEFENVSTTTRTDAASKCQVNSTHRAHIFGLPKPEHDVIRLATGTIHSLRLVSFDTYGQRRCSGGDYFETELKSSYWKSRPPVIDHGDGSYDLKLHVDARFAGNYTFKVILVFTNFDGLKQLDPGLASHEYKGYLQDKVVSNLNFDFALPLRELEAPAYTAAKSTVPVSDIKLCKGEDFKNKRQWSGRWTRGEFNPNCTTDLEELRTLKCLSNETECERPWCEGAVGKLQNNCWVYSAHCSFRLFSQDEAWQCLDGKWLFWSNDYDDKENVVLRNLLESVLGLSFQAGQWDTIGRFSNRVFDRPEETMAAQQQHHSREGAKNPKQQVRMTNMWNANAELNPEKSQGLLGYYFTKFFSPDVVIMNTGLQDGPTQWHSWKELLNVSVKSAANFWKETFESILPNRHPRVILTTPGPKSISEFNPQVVDMYNRFLLDAYIKANLTSDFRTVDGFDYSYSRLPGRYQLGIRRQYFVDLMLVHMLLTAICVD